MVNKILIRLNIIVLVGLILINILGVFMPELGFDALWYHLPLSKLFLAKHQWYFSGGLYYYSAMPRLAELISLPLFSVYGFSGPKLLQFVSGLIVSFLIYRLAKKLTSYQLPANQLLSLTAVNLFYATWLVSWQSSSGYVDLVRTVFEVSALYLLIIKPLALRHVRYAGILFGLAIGTKWHALGSLAVAAVIFSPFLILPALLVASPWFYLAYRFTGNPVYPLFEKFMTTTQLSQVESHYYSLLSIIKRFLLAPVFLTRPSEDFLSPLIGLVFGISLLALFSSNKLIRKISLYGLLGTILLLLTPPPSTRYYLPYLPAVILAAVYVISRLKTKISLYFVALFTSCALLVLTARLLAFRKYLPYLFGGQNLNQFLTSQSYRLPDTFIDSDNYVQDNLPATGKYLISRLHNLYYFPFDFDHDSFFDPAKRYDYLITTNTAVELIKGKLLHTNQLGIQIFKL